MSSPPASASTSPARPTAERVAPAAEPSERRGAADSIPQASSPARLVTPTLRQRRTWLACFRRLLASRIDPLVESIQAEVGKPRSEAVVSDLLPLLAACRWHERHLHRILRPRRVGGTPIWLPGQRVTRRQEPLGRVAIIATWNYPVQLLGVQVVQAIAGGNQVVVKPSELVPRTQELLLRTAQEALLEAGLPAETLTWTEATRAAGQALLAAGGLDHVVFTGSTRIGRAIAEIAAQSLTPTTLELSGSDSAIVLADADVDLAARTIWNAVVMNAGQTCMAPRRVLVDRRVWAKFIAALAPLAAAAKPVRLISEAAAAQAYRAARLAVDAGGRSASAVLEPNEGPWLRPLAVLDAPEDGPLAEGDHFGPVVAVIAVRDLDDALRIHRSSPRRLAVSLFTRSPRRGMGQMGREMDGRLVGELGATTITINDCVRPVGHPGAVLGGRGESGWGVSRGEEGLRAMTRPVCVCTTGRWLRAPVDAPEGRRLAMVERLVRWIHGGRTEHRSQETSGPSRSHPEVASGARPHPPERA